MKWIGENIISIIAWTTSLTGAVLLHDMPTQEFFGILLLVAGGAIYFSNVE